METANRKAEGLHLVLRGSVTLAWTCAIAQASASMLTDAVKRKTVREAQSRVRSRQGKSSRLWQGGQYPDPALLSPNLGPSAKLRPGHRAIA
jgi:hypothetical protein